MTEKELKKLNRYQLLELLVEQTERAEKLQQKVQELEDRLEERDLNLSKLGSVAEAAVQVSGILEAAQKTADLYLAATKKQADDYLAHARRQAAAMIVQAEAKVRYISEQSCGVVTGKQKEHGKEV